MENLFGLVRKFNKVAVFRVIFKKKKKKPLPFDSMISDWVSLWKKVSFTTVTENKVSGNSPNKNSKDY